MRKNLKPTYETLNLSLRLGNYLGYNEEEYQNNSWDSQLPLETRKLIVRWILTLNLISFLQIKWKIYEHIMIQKVLIIYN